MPDSNIITQQSWKITYWDVCIFMFTYISGQWMQHVWRHRSWCLVRSRITVSRQCQELALQTRKHTHQHRGELKPIPSEPWTLRQRTEEWMESKHGRRQRRWRAAGFVMITNQNIFLSLSISSKYEGAFKKREMYKSLSNRKTKIFSP